MTPAEFSSFMDSYLAMQRGCSPVKVKVGKGKNGPNTVGGTGATHCPSRVSRDNWDKEAVGGKHANVGDKFGVEVKDGDVIVTRDNRQGWGMNLVFDCEKCDSSVLKGKKSKKDKKKSKKDKKGKKKKNGGCVDGN